MHSWSGTPTREAGYDDDLVDDTALHERDLSRYRVVVLPLRLHGGDMAGDAHA
jgi:hypothetical protein